MWGWLSPYGHSVFLVSTIIAAIFGGIGIGAAFISAIVGYQLTEEALSEANVRIAAADSNAKKEITKSNILIEQARKETAEANARALEAKLELERFRAPRVLTLDQLVRIVGKISSFAGTPFSLTVNPSPEPQMFMGHIAAALEAAGWNRLAWKKSTGIQLSVPGKPSAGVETGFLGLAIEIDSSRAEEWTAAFRALASSLRQEGFELKANIANDGSAEPDSIHIFVGAKP